MTETVQENFSAEAIQELNQRFEGRSPQEVLTYALERFFPKVVLACSFGAEDMVLWDMMHRINPRASLFYLDTDFLFPETYAVRDRLMDRYKVSAEQVIRVVPALTPGGASEAVRRSVVGAATGSVLPNPKSRSVDQHLEKLLRMGDRHSSRPVADARTRGAGGMGRQVRPGQVQSTRGLVQR